MAEPTETEQISFAAAANVALDLLAWSARRGDFDAARTPVEIESYLRAREIDSLWYLATGGTASIQQVYDAAWRRQLAVTRDVLRALQGAGLDPLTIKSGELVPAAFGERSLGFIGDVDMLLPRPQMGEARRVLLECGFRQAYFDPSIGRLVHRDVADIARIESVHYELAPFLLAESFDLDPAYADIVRRRDHNPVRLAGDQAVLIIEVDLHHNLAADVEAEGFFARAVPSHHGVGRTLSSADHIWILLTRHYTETALHGKRSLRPFAYLIPLVARGGVDWSVVEQSAVELELGPSLYYYLALVDKLVPGHVPQELLARIHPQFTPRARDWGWQLAQVLGTVEPFPIDFR